MYMDEINYELFQTAVTAFVKRTKTAEEVTEDIVNDWLGHGDWRMVKFCHLMARGLAGFGVY
jgi:hypothetical protein